jgi:pimeloyl-ACP methyl ester carboxylesterase
MKQPRIFLLAGFLCLALQSRSLAQPEQYELGRRIGAFELAWEKNTDAQARKKALAILRPTTLLMLTSKFDEAGRAFDDARHAIADAKEVPPATLWAESLCVRLGSRLIDAKETVLPFTVQQFYSPKAPPVPDTRVGLQLVSGLGGKPYEVSLTQLPMEASLPLINPREGDHLVHITVRTGDKIAAQTLFRVSVVKDLKPRLERLKQATAAFGGQRGNTDQESVREIYEKLTALDAKQTPQSDYPAARLLAEAESAVEAIKAGKNFYGGDKAGQFWLRLPAGPSAVPVRLLAPDAVKDNKPLPLVIAMHGIAGSENLFFEAFGAGLTVKLCRERGWLLVAPHKQLLGNYSPAAVIDEVAKLYPVDKSKVFVIGHSLGARDAVNAAMQSPGRIAAVAALGGGQVKVKADVRQVPFYIGIGTSDIAAISARGLYKNLKMAGVNTVEYREYPDVEHFVIVREALPDAFAMFDRVAKAK